MSLKHFWFGLIRTLSVQAGLSLLFAESLVLFLPTSLQVSC